MAEKVASLYAEITADTSGLKSGLATAKTGMQQAGKQADTMGASLKKALTSAAVVGGINAIVSGLKYMVNQAMEAEQVMAVTAATIEATGGAAGYTADEIAALAQAESNLTAIDDEVVQSGLNMLLTFKNIGEETLPQATRAMQDMAVAMAGGDTSAVDLKATAIQLGKALNDPIAGVTALRKVGVTLSEAQQQQIKDFMAVNDLAGAQAIILAELESEFGGVAAAAGDTTAGKFAKLQNSFNNLAAAAGDKLIPVLTDASDALLTIVNASQQINAALATHEQAVAQAAGSYEDYQREIYRSVAASTGLTDVTKFAALALDEQAEKVNRLAPDLDIMTRAEWDAANAAAEMEDKLGASAIAYGNNSTAALTAADATNNYGQAVNTSISTIDGVTASFEKMTKELIFNAAAQNMSAEEALKLGIQMGLVDAETLGYMSAMDELNAKLEAGDITMIGYRDAVAALGQQIEDEANNPHTIDVTVRVDDQELNDFMAQWHDLGAVGATVGQLPGMGGQPIARAIGGSVKGGYPVKWQEVGGELFVPEQDGTVLSHGDLMRMINALSAGQGQKPGATYNININGNASATDIIRRARIAEAYGV